MRKNAFQKGVNESISTHLKGYILNEAKKEKVSEIISVSFEGILQEIAKNYGAECIMESKKCNQEQIVCALQIQKHTKILTTIKIKNPTFKEQFENFVKLVADKQSTFESLQNFAKKNKDISFNKALALHSYIPFMKFSKPQKALLSSNLKDLRVQIPQDAESIPEDAFRDITSLAYVKISEGVVRIETSAFMYCRTLKEVELPSTLTYIGKFAFDGCVSLEQINIPNSVTQIDELAFRDCRSLKSIVLPNKLKEIEYEVFNHAGLESITIPESVSHIGVRALNGCPLKVIYGTKDSLAKEVAEKRKAKYVEIQE